VGLWEADTYGVDPDELLEAHDPNSDDGALPAPVAEAVEPRCDLQLEPAGTAPILQSRMPLAVDFLRESNLGADLAPLPVHARVRGGKASQLGENMKRLVVAAFAGQPAGREGEEDDAAGKDEAGDHLEEEGEPPRPFARHVAGAIGGPEGDDDAEDDAEFLEDEEGAADFGGCDLGYVERCYTGQSGGC
jgi:hypothetical protein